MSFHFILSLIATLFTMGIATVVLLKDTRSFIHRLFALGMVFFSLEALFGGLIIQFSSYEKIVYWCRWKLILSSLWLGIWLVFSLVFSREEDRKIIRKWFWLILCSFLLPFILASLFRKNLFLGEPVIDPSSFLVIRLGWSGYLFYLFYLLIIILILMNLEKILRGTTGLHRQAVKYLIFGLGSILAIRFYTGSSYLLFKSYNLGHESINASGLIVGGLLIIPSLRRMKILDIDIYLSPSFLYGSFTILIAGIYLLSVGVIVQLISSFSIGGSIYFKVFLVFLAFIGLCILLFSDRIRVKTKQFISLHLRRPHYDYRKVWESFTQTTASLIHVKALCNAIAKFISETFEIMSVTVWLYDEAKDRLRLGGSTAFFQKEGEILKTFSSQGVKELISGIKEQDRPVDIKGKNLEWVKNLKENYPNFFEAMKIRWLIPLKSGKSFIGFITLDERISKIPFSIEDFNLLKTISDQSARSLLSLQLFEELEKAKEMEAFQTMSSFVVHDLKNLASTLSLTLMNLPIHFDNPEFRKDALEVISNSVTKIKKMCNELALLSQKFEIKPLGIDLNKLIEEALSFLNGIGPLNKDLHPLPELNLDPEQIKKVITNLVLNAKEATTGGEPIEIQTGQAGDWVFLSVKDYGCGMSEDFIENSLFRPFKTTKKNGMGIGLFHSKRIVEAHGGRIEVESQQGKGSTFRVYLPLGNN